MRDKAVMLDEFAKTYLSAGNLAAAQRSAEESNAILQRLAETGGANKEFERNVSVSLIRLGDVKRAQGDGPGALAAYEAGLANDRKRAEADTANPVAQQDVSIDLDRIADIKLYGGDSAGALKAYEESLGIRRALVAADPSNTERQRAMSVSLGKICDVKRDAGDAKARSRPARRNLISRAGSLRPIRAIPSCSATWRSASNGSAASSSARATSTLRWPPMTRASAFAAAWPKIDEGNSLWQRDVAIGLGEIADVKIAEKRLGRRARGL